MSAAISRISSISIIGYLLPDLFPEDIEWGPIEHPPLVADPPALSAQPGESREFWLKNFQDDRLVAYQHSVKEWRLGKIVRRDGRDVVLQGVDFNLKPFGDEISRRVCAGEMGRARWYFFPPSKRPSRVTTIEFRRR